MRKGSNHSEESKHRISKSHKGKRLSVEHRQNLGKAHRGLSHSEATRLKIGCRVRKSILAIQIEGNKKIKYQSIQQFCNYFKITVHQFWRMMKKDQICKGYRISYLPRGK